MLYVGFVVQHILGIVGSHIEVERVFNVEGICTSLQHILSPSTYTGTVYVEFIINKLDLKKLPQ
jgi:hypothetical protein